jgi:CDP-glycerol glycerophosphotransferase
MTLGIPCVSTNIPGPDDVLANGLGLLTELTAEALADAVIAIKTGNFTPRKFDAKAYNLEAFIEFNNAVSRKEHSNIVSIS